MIAYDLGGVFTSDIMFEGGDLEHLLYFRHNHTKPIFEPSGDFYILTGRPKEDEPHTLKWINTHWINKPLKVFHENDDFMKGAEYKLAVLIENPDIHAFIESSERQCEYIRAGLRHNLLHHVAVIHFASMVRMAAHAYTRRPYEVLP